MLLNVQQLYWAFLGWQTSLRRRQSPSWIPLVKYHSLMTLCCLESTQKSRSNLDQKKTLISEICICIYAFEIFQNQSEGFLYLNWILNLNRQRWWIWYWNRNKQWMVPRYKIKGIIIFILLSLGGKLPFYQINKKFWHCNIW